MKYFASFPAKERKLPSRLIPRDRRCKGQYFRQFISGIMDGRIENCPYYARDLVKTEIDKSLWENARVKTSNIYRLTEPALKPVDGATYLYEYQL